ncbi:MAG: leucine--tRNA ligase [candidate division WOR-3 bacterium]|jgi:leucyl-tRNA synthetase|nr:leucine--tRNA ligase [candidate division WOR-3 bacterium]MDH7519589.1 leucine--tRNA ligase [bacterium]
MSDYPTREIELKWQRFWEEKGVFKTNPNPKKKYYVLEMFLYPSGDMHMGHARNYCIGDCVARLKMMQGYDVLHPFGWDAFGLPAENAAIEHNIPPWVWTFDSIELCKKNLKLLGIGYDWDREVTTCRPEYYRWNQWLFLKFYERGLVYRKEAYVNWCPRCQTVLANEQVIEGRCYRSSCAAPVEKKKLTQWFFKITDYAQELLDGIEGLTGWPESVRVMQRNWIGRSEGVEVDFQMDDGTRLPVWTTRPDTLYGVTFLALAPDAPLAETVARGTPQEHAVADFCHQVLIQPEIERTAVGREKQGIFTGRFARNPLSGEMVPIWVADFVLAGYGTGMVMGVPGHDQRDFEFARKYNIPIKVVIVPEGKTLVPEEMAGAYTEPGVMVNSGPFDGTPSEKGIQLVIEELERRNIGRRKVQYRLKDWLISRQRYWGTPIPMIHCPQCGIVPVPYEQLPVLLPPDVKDYKPKGKSVLAGVESFINTTCPKCGGPAQRDPDTMDTFVDSSWYHLRYTDPHNDKLPFTRENADKWLPIDEYIGGIEHACGHLIFFRFFTRVLHDLGMVSVKEPCRVLHTQGMVSLDGKTMSSSRRHGVWVGPFVEEHGADCARLGVLFAAPPEKPLEWSNELVTGVKRFIARVWRLFEDAGYQLPPDKFEVEKFSAEEKRLYIRLNQTHKKVITDADSFQFNTAISALMEFLNELYLFPDRKSPVFRFALVRFVKLLAPFAPHLSEELWHRFYPGKGSIFCEPMPEWDERFVHFDTIEIPVQVNGKLRGKVVVSRTSGEEEVKKAALENSAVLPYIEGKEIIRVVLIPGRVVNIVVR